MSAGYSKKQVIARLRALEEISVELIRPQDTHEVLNSIVNKAVDLFQCDAGSLYLNNQDELFLKSQ